ncbi:MAG: copper transporter, partial [Bifidobacteriaceae bacterium]|nr:copper transporter [Bifidobacteriaceae bacterium]
MINFRYHVVSLVAVFLALAVGIVLGAGPLKEPIGATLAEQVSALRAEKDALRDQFQAASDRGAWADAEFAGLAPAALDGMLTGRPVAVVTIGSELDSRAEALERAIALAGAIPAGQVHIKDALLNGSADARAALADQLTPNLIGISPAADDQAVIAAGLAQALAGLTGPARGSEPAPQDEDPDEDPGADPEPGSNADPAAGAEPDGDADAGSGSADGPGDQPDPAATAGETDPDNPNGQDNPDDPGPGGPDDTGAGDLAAAAAAARALELWTTLEGSGLVAGAPTESAAAVVVLAGPYILDPTAIDEAEVTAAREAASLTIPRALAAEGLVTVVAGPDQTGTDLVRRVLGDSGLKGAVSVVVAPLAFAEAITAVWAVAAGMGGVRGAWGLIDGESTLPAQLPAPVPPPPEP